MDGKKKTARLIFNPDKITARQYRELYDVLIADDIESEPDIDYIEFEPNGAYIQRTVNNQSENVIRGKFEDYLKVHRKHKFHISLEFDNDLEEILGD